NYIFNKCFALLILDEEKFINKKYDKNNPLIYELVSNKKKRYVISYELHTIQYEDENYIYECDVSNHIMDKLSVLTRSIFG
ncbi:MAG: hypothetical protein L0L39_05335, partial [Atopostipes suicloacalis]|nr:hypothetical protein [Atopostipes suicloacalis]